MGAARRVAVMRWPWQRRPAAQPVYELSWNERLAAMVAERAASPEMQEYRRRRAAALKGRATRQ